MKMVFLHKGKPVQGWTACQQEMCNILTLITNPEALSHCIGKLQLSAKMLLKHNVRKTLLLFFSIILLDSISTNFKMLFFWYTESTNTNKELLPKLHLITICQTESYEVFVLITFSKHRLTNIRLRCDRQINGSRSQSASQAHGCSVHDDCRVSVYKVSNSPCVEPSSLSHNLTRNIKSLYCVL